MVMGTKERNNAGKQGRKEECTVLDGGLNGKNWSPRVQVQGVCRGTQLPRRWVWKCRAGPKPSLYRRGNWGLGRGRNLKSCRETIGQCRTLLWAWVPLHDGLSPSCTSPLPWASIIRAKFILVMEKTGNREVKCCPGRGKGVVLATGKVLPWFPTHAVAPKAARFWHVTGEGLQEMRDVLNYHPH